MVDQNEETGTLTWECPNCGNQNETAFDESARHLTFSDAHCENCNTTISSQTGFIRVSDAFQQKPEPNELTAKEREAARCLAEHTPFDWEPYTHSVLPDTVCTFGEPSARHPNTYGALSREDGGWKLKISIDYEPLDYDYNREYGAQASVWAKVHSETVEECLAEIVERLKCAADALQFDPVLTNGIWGKIHGIDPDP